MLAVLVAVVLLPAPAAARPEQILAGPSGGEVEIDTDRIVYNWEKRVLRLEGHVVVRRGEGVLRAGAGELDRERQVLTLSGGVLGFEGRQVFLADGAIVDLAARTADLRSATLYLKERAVSPGAPTAGPNSLTLRAARLRQLPGGAVVAEEVTMTPCDCVGAPDYELLASRAELEGDRARLRGTRLRLLGASLPLFPLSVPLTGRQSGLLGPQLGFTGQSGFAYAQPVFVTLGQSHDVTITPGLYTGAGGRSSSAPGSRSLRGPRLGLEYRYAPAPGTSGQISFDLVGDLNQNDSPASGPLAFGEPGIASGRGFGGVRGIARVAHRTESPEAIFALQGTVATDAMALADQQPAGIDRAFDVLRTDAGLWRAAGPLTVGAAATFLQDIRLEEARPDVGLFGPDRRLFGPERPRTFQRLPAAFAQLAPVPFGPATVSVEASAAQFVAPAGADPREGITGFGPTDLNAAAAVTPLPDAGRRPALRLDASPRISVAGPAALPIDLRLEAGARLDAWLFENDAARNRTRVYGILGARAAFPLERSFGDRLHRIEPAVSVRALTRPLRGGAPGAIGDPADGGGAGWFAAPDAAEQGLPPGLARMDGGVAQGVPASRRPYDEIDGAAPSTGAVEATFEVAQSLWSRGGRIARLDLLQDALLWAPGAGGRIGETAAALLLQLGSGSLQGTARYDWHDRAVSVVSAGGGLRDARGDELHASALLLRPRASAHLRAGIDELFSAVRLAAAGGDLGGAAWAGASAPVPLGRPGLRVGYDVGRTLGFILPGAPDWVHRLTAVFDTPCRCASIGLSVEAPLRDGRLLNGPVVRFRLDLKSLGSFASF